MAGAGSPTPVQADARRVVTVVEHDHSWAERFDETRARILEAVTAAGLTQRVVAVEHMGSTSVAALAAKPILDILIGVESWPAERVVQACSEELGLHHHGELGWPGRDYLTDAPAGAPRSLHVHVVEHGSWFWTETLRFRDHLRSNPDDADDYARLKRRLAHLHRDDPFAYTDGKTAFVRAVLREARAGAGERQVTRLPADDEARVPVTVPEEALDHVLAQLGLGPGKLVVKIGAKAEGITPRLLTAGANVTVVDPLWANRRRMLTELDGTLHVMDGRAEEIDIPGQRVDAVVAGHASRWFEPWAALAEFHRILLDDQHLGLVWTHRLEAGHAVDDWRRAWDDALKHTGIFTQPEWTAFEHSPHRTDATVLTRVGTRLA